ncbi:hypothetical protein GCM10008107_17310 [Psychrosphaera saromensis]|nr:hypothetical protein [Psychrosphaera saromensis]GHB68375.1 hypothetical protein GCM10008107_17310 [Psychrosphaera saromensis]GLQ15187.1 hypothetical protein GCM10007917_26420 [Psychrosphaera saromensis]
MTKFKTINTLSVLMLLTGLALAIFGYWGLCTKAGNEVYPEMAGLIPFYSLLASLPFLLLAAIGAFVSYRKQRLKR